MNTIIKRVEPQYPQNNLDIIKEAALILKNGGLVVFPTETVYGLGALYNNSEAVNKIYAAKGRPADNPLIVHICDIAQLSAVAREIPPLAYALAEKRWPGPLTLVLKKHKTVPDCVTCFLDTVAVRLPSNPIARLLIQNSAPIAAPSANASGSPSPTLAAHVTEDLSGKVDFIIDGGACDVGLESTIVDLSGENPVILRPGGVSKEEIELYTGKKCETARNTNGKPKAPGMKYRHYAPRAKVTVVSGESVNVAKRINAALETLPQCKTGILAFDETKCLYPKNAVVLSMGKKSEPAENAHNLFRLLRCFDEHGCERIFAEALQGGGESGLAEAVMNRLIKAAGEDLIYV